MQKIFDQEFFQTYNQGLDREWLLTNGLGGYSSLSLIGAPTNRYHALFVASLCSPVKRKTVLSHIVETVKYNNHKFQLTCFQNEQKCFDNTDILKEVHIGSTVTYVYQIDDLSIKKIIHMPQHKSAICVQYCLVAGKHKMSFDLHPFINYRTHHDITHDNSPQFFTTPYKNRCLIIPDVDKQVQIYLRSSHGYFTKDEKYETLKLPIEEMRCQTSTVTNYSPCHLSIDIEPYQELILEFTCELGQQSLPDMKTLIDADTIRLQSLYKGKNDIIAQLIQTADQFIVQRDHPHGLSVIAGYPWFSDWGRDTLIAFKGLFLRTQRYVEAREILLLYSKSILNGLVVNTYQEEDNVPIYNTVDASLWLINAAYEYAQFTNDYEFIFQNIYDQLKSIILWYIKGTSFDIHMCDDFLLHAGSKQDQITWMDVRLDGIAITPRHGKPVEINALWYNSLKIMEDFACRYGEDESKYSLLSKRCAKSFRKKFFYKEGGYLYDVVDPYDTSIRPNQYYALSLPFSAISKKQSQIIFETIEQDLYTPKGIRTLSPRDKNYIGQQRGNQKQRDLAYHQGCTWSHLIGPYIRSYLRIYNNKTEALLKIQPLINSLYDGCINGVSEIFEGDYPHMPRGAINQAWSVAELLDVYMMITK